MMIKDIKLLKPKQNYLIECDKINFAEEDYDISNVKVKDISINIKNEKIRFDSCYFENINFIGSVLTEIEILDSVFINCDFSNINMQKSDIHRTEFKNCKLLGCDLNESNFKNVLIEDSISKYINLSFSNFKSVILKNNDFDNASFNNSSFEDLLIEECNLNESDFSKTKLVNIDLSTDNIENIKLSGEELRGSIISVIQTLDIARFLGVIIKEESNN